MANVLFPWMEPRNVAFPEATQREWRLPMPNDFLGIVTAIKHGAHPLEATVTMNCGHSYRVTGILATAEVGQSCVCERCYRQSLPQPTETA